jgi:shikimate kinase
MSRRCVVLIGMMGAGKTEVGTLLSEELGYEYLDTDEVVAKRAGKSIPKIFAEDGEKVFRDLESQAIHELEGRRSLVVATGGGAPVDPTNARTLRALGSVVYLKASAIELYQRIKNDKGRPLLQVENPKAEMAKLLASREPVYKEVSDFTMDTEELSVDEVVAKLIDELARRTIETQGEE